MHSPRLRCLVVYGMLSTGLGKLRYRWSQPFPLEEEEKQRKTPPRRVQDKDQDTVTLYLCLPSSYCASFNYKWLLMSCVYQSSLRVPWMGLRTKSLRHTDERLLGERKMSPYRNRRFTVKGLGICLSSYEYLYGETDHRPSHSVMYCGCTSTKDTGQSCPSRDL